MTILCVGALASVALLNAMRVYVLLAHGELRTGIPIPLSLVIAAALIWIVKSSSRPMEQRFCPGAASRRMAYRVWLRVAAVCLSCAVLFPLLQMFCFGKTDYRRQADVAVVLGARAYVDGQPSDALADRVRTGCELYRQGLVHKLILSGGPGDGPVTEPESMKRLALRLGVRAEDMTLDETGLNTQATVNNTLALFSESHATRVLVVSHFYHLPRIKISYQSAGCEVLTVPARETYLLRQTPYNIAREVAALWLYYIRAVRG